MSADIIEAAVINPTLRLQLNDNISSRLEASSTQDERGVGNKTGNSGSSINEEFVCLVNVLRGTEGEPL